MTDRVCENCAMADDELLLVRRVYLQPDAEGAPTTPKVADETELWCVSCVTQYPCEPAED